MDTRWLPRPFPLPKRQSPGRRMASGLEDPGRDFSWSPRRARRGRGAAAPSQPSVGPPGWRHPLRCPRDRRLGTPEDPWRRQNLHGLVGGWRPVSGMTIPRPVPYAISPGELGARSRGVAGHVSGHPAAGEGIPWMVEPQRDSGMNLQWR